MTEQQTLSFETEEAKEAALAGLPEAPPFGTTDIEGWRRDIEAREKAIESAEIGPKKEDATVSQIPVKPPEPETVTPDSPAPVPVDDEVVIRVKRNELPEELRNYKDGGQILKQFAHARGNINRVSEKLEQTEAELTAAKTSAQQVAALQKQLDELQKASKVATQTVSGQHESVAKSVLQERIAEINKSIDVLTDTEDEIDRARLRETMAGMMSVLNDAVGNVTKTEQQLMSYRSETEGKYKTLETELVEGRKLTQQQEIQKQQNEALRELVGLQEKYRDLQTTMPVVTSDGRGCVEGSVVKFAEAIHGSTIPRGKSEEFWATVNKYVNMFNRQEPQLLQHCQENSIFPANYGISDKDVINYGILMNVDALQRGERIDPETGRREILKDFRGRQITFPDGDAAYKYMLDKMGIREKEYHKALIEAEKKGQRALDASLSKRDVSDALIGPEGLGSPDNVGHEITEEVAREILGERNGPNTVDEEKMEVLIRMKDARGWAMFDRMNKANKRLGLPDEPVEPDWPPRPKAQ